MKVLDPGHTYELTCLDARHEQHLQFVKREGPNYPDNVGHYPGVLIQEVLRACIDRVKYLDKQIPDFRNELVLGHLRQAIWNLEWRAAERHGRQVLNSICDELELIPTKENGHWKFGDLL